jgi:hypothetical protein
MVGVDSALREVRTRRSGRHHKTVAAPRHESDLQAGEEMVDHEAWDHDLSTKNDAAHECRPSWQHKHFH